jgi:hypothetical protein
VEQLCNAKAQREQSNAKEKQGQKKNAIRFRQLGKGIPACSSLRFFVPFASLRCTVAVL